jgi:glycosyltransferase involved in cell wall biosynthesis
MADKPLVSIFMFVRNGARALRRAVDSVMAQTYPNIEFVVQDAASTDATLDILKGYGERLKLVSEPDSGPSEGLWRAANRCSGEIVGSCLADEELAPDAVERAVRAFQASPKTGAITGDALITDIDGKVTGTWTSGPFNLASYLLGDYSPYLVSSFYRRSVLLDVGLASRDWNLNCVEFELWCRVATHSHVQYVPYAFAKYAQHPDQLSHSPHDALVHVRGRLANITALCAPGGFFDDQPLLRSLFIWGHARTFCNHAVVMGRPELAREEYKLFTQAIAEQPTVLLDGVPYDPDYTHRFAADEAWKRFEAAVPALAWRLYGPARKEALRRRRSEALVSQRRAAEGDLRFPPPPTDRQRAQIFELQAGCYEARGNSLAAHDSKLAAALAEGRVEPAEAGYRADRKYGWAPAAP